MKQTEHDSQVILVRWFDLQYPKYAGRLYAVPNGGARHPAVAAKLKAEGVRRGIPDLHLPIRTPFFSGLVIEMKAETGRMTVEQADWIDFFSSQGFAAVVCKSLSSAQETIKSYIRQIPSE